MTDGEILYLLLVGSAALAFVVALAYATTVASRGPQPDEVHQGD